MFIAKQFTASALACLLGVTLVGCGGEAEESNCNLLDPFGRNSPDCIGLRLPRTTPCDITAEDSDGDCYPDAIERRDCVCSAECKERAVQNPNIHPGAPDTSNDGVDQDCNGVDGPRPNIVTGDDGGSTIPDGGQPVPDAGNPQPDAGQPIPDAGQPVPDAGQPQPDAGTPANPTCGGARGPELVVNGNFSQNPNLVGWTTDHPNNTVMTWANGPTTPSQGNPWMEARALVVGDPSEAQVKTFVPVAPGTYHLCFKVWTNTPGQVLRMQLMNDQAPYEAYKTVSYDLPAGVTIQQEETIVVTTTNVSARLAFQVGQSTHTFGFDDVSFRRE